MEKQCLHLRTTSIAEFLVKRSLRSREGQAYDPRVEVPDREFRGFIRNRRIERAALFSCVVARWAANGRARLGSVSGPPLSAFQNSAGRATGSWRHAKKSTTPTIS